MPKKRRKLSRELEKEISLIKKRVELITAKIHDIDDEELQQEYNQGFETVLIACIYLSDLYQQSGVTPETDEALSRYKVLIKQFEDEFEI